MFRVRRGGKAPAVGAPERLPLRWGVILMASAETGVVAFAAGGPLAAIGTASVVLAALHKVLA